MKTTEITAAKLYVGTYAKYNNSSIAGDWLTLSDYSDVEEFLAACAELHADEEDPEYMFQDYEGFPKFLYSESLSGSDLEKLFEYVAIQDDLINADWLSLHNDYCMSAGDPDNQIYTFDDEFFEMAFSGEPMKAARAASFGTLNWSDDYITFNGYGNLESISDIESYIEMDEIIADILDNPRNYSL